MSEFGLGFALGYALGMLVALLILIVLILVRARLDELEKREVPDAVER